MGSDYWREALLALENQYDPVEKSSTSMMADSKLLLNFEAQSCKASLQMPEYWSSASEKYLIS